MKRWIAVILVILVSLLWIGCSAQTPQSGDYASEKSTPDGEDATGGSSGNGDIGSPANNSDVARKIVRDATLDLEAVDVVKAYEDLLAWASEHDGYEVNRTQNKTNGFISIDASIKMNPDALDAFLEYAATVGDVINTRIDTEDITESYYDTETRLRSMEESLERYFDFLDQSANIEESLSVQREINSLTVEIESLKGKLKVWDSLLAESIVTIRLRQSNDPAKIRREITWSTLSFADMLYLMQSGLMRVANIFVSVLQWIAVILVATAPLWVIALIVIFIIRKRRKKRKAQKAADSNEQSVPKNTV